MADFFAAANSVFKKEVTRRSSCVLVIYFGIISLLEVLAYRNNGIFSVLASRIWLFTAVLLFVLFVVLAAMTAVKDIKEKHFFSLIGFLLLFGFFCFFIGNLGYSDVNADSCQQAAAGLEAFKAKDFNYTGTAFLGYPSRQYLLAAIPALLFGRSIFTLQLGFAWPFLLGLSLMFMELKELLKSKNVDEKLALIPVYSFLCFPFIAEYYMNFEQAITPVALTMIGIALFLRFRRKHDAVTAVALAFVGCFACDSYTPVLAALGLLLAFLVLHVFELVLYNRKAEDNQKVELPYIITATGGILLNILSFFAATMLVKRADRIEKTREDIKLFDFAKETFKEFFTDANATFLGLFMGIVILYMFLSFILLLKFHNFVISVWMLAVVFLSNFMVGYTTYNKAWIMQRNMIIIPVLITAIFTVCVNILQKYGIKLKAFTVSALLTFCLVAGIFSFSNQHQSFTYFKYVQPMKFLIQDLNDTLKRNGIKNTDEFNIALFSDNVLEHNIYDYAKFFFPNANAVSDKLNTQKVKLDPTLKTFYYADDEHIKAAGDDTVIPVTFKNKRYQTTCTWYKYTK